MKNIVMLCVFALSVPALLYSQTQKERATATVTSVHATHGISPNSYAGTNPSDAPLQSSYYTYDIAVRLNCTKYVVRYESASDYLPAAFAAHQQLPAHADKHSLFFEVPGYGQMDMAIVSHSGVEEGTCRSGSSGYQSGRDFWAGSARGTAC